MTKNHDFSHKLENQILIFKNRKVVAYSPLNNIIDRYKKILLKNQK
jgi:hypothetical protein